MSCELYRARLDAYVDVELDAEAMRSIDSHLRGCPECASDALRRQMLKRATQLAGRRYSPAPELRKKVQLQIQRRSSTQWLWRWLPQLAVAAALLAMVIGLSWWRANQRRSDIYAEVADLHVAALASSTPVDVVSSDRHTVKPWFAGKLPFTFNLPELEGTGFRLLGGRMTYLNQSPGAQLIFQVRKHDISVFVFQDRAGLAGLGSNASAPRDLSFNVKTWSDHGLRYFAVSDANRADLDQLAALMRAAE